jgi:3-deoxy-7-phosphoheptulonate synthase
MQQTENLNIEAFDLLPTPEEVHARLPLSDAAAESVLAGRRALERILDGSDPRVFVVVGPCSIHDPVAGLDYARRLKALADEVAGTMVLVMRVYFEKPRTATGWKGYINDPRMDDSFHIEEGLHKAREFLLAVNELGLPAGTEALDPIAPQYLGDLIAWTAIGARTSESQTHREMSSGLSTPVGFKNGTDGSLDAAVNAVISASSPHSFLGINMQGRSCVVRTAGNRYGHLVLRGGGGRPNYDTVSVALAEAALAKAKLPHNIVVDCSHANSYKKPELQPLVMHDCINQICDQRKAGHRSIVGLMIESFIEAGNQPIPADLASQLEVRLFGHRRLRRLADHRKNDPRRRCRRCAAPPHPCPRSKMSLIRPFRGLRPAAGQAGAVAAPPYDVLSSDEARVVHGAPPASPGPSCTSPSPKSTCRRDRPLLAGGLCQGRGEPAEDARRRRPGARRRRPATTPIA